MGTDSYPDSTYTNPLKVFVADPYVLKVEDTYYLYGTSVANMGFKVWESNDLVNWEEKGFAFSKFEEGNEWGQGDFWAPEVVSYKNKYYMIYSARASDGHLKIALAESSSPIGPFLNIKAPLFDKGFSNIDGHIFIDSDGTPYLFYVRDCSENIIDGKHISQIYVQKMSKDLLTLEGDPILVVEPSQDWEGIGEDWQWNEGPFVIKENGIYYLLYSANYFASPEYAIGYATADNPMGPWIKSEDNPILSKDLSLGVSGPGHCSVTNSPDSSELFIVYHSHAFPKSPSGIRVLNIDRIYFNENGELRIKGPTRTPQPFPY
ncbi:glycoside hydrolase [Petrotoga sp. 9PW.55.5.1]|nr:glycoside hydrolase [Petrotoga sp. 9PW.55.5.1]